MRATGMGGDSVVVTRVSSQMAPAHGNRCEARRSSRTLFAVGRLTRRTKEIRVVEQRSAVRLERTGEAKTVH